jgi:hypothetical protein
VTIDEGIVAAGQLARRSAGAAAAVVAAAIPLVVHRGKKPAGTPVHAL